MGGKRLCFYFHCVADFMKNSNKKKLMLRNVMGEEVVRIAESKRKAEVKQASDEKRILRAESQERLRFWIPRLHRS